MNKLFTNALPPQISFGDKNPEGLDLWRQIRNRRFKEIAYRDQSTHLLNDKTKTHA